MQKLIKVILIIPFFLMCIFFVAATNIETEQVTLENGVVWYGELNDRVIIKAKIKGKLTTIDGNLVTVTKLYLKVNNEKELVFIDTITSIQSYYKRFLVKNGVIVDKYGRRVEQERIFEGDSERIVTIVNVSDEETEDSIDEEKSEQEPSNEKPTEQVATKTIIVPLRGNIGVSFGRDYIGEAGWFNAWLLEEVLKKADADRDNVTTVILEIDSNGGYIVDEREICDLIQLYRGTFEFIAYPHTAFSAASTIVMTCDKLIASPDSKVGAAVAISGEGNAVGEKFESADASIVRTYFLNGGKPVEIAKAMGLMEYELWFNSSSQTFSNNSHVDELDWELVDGSESILTFDSKQLIAYGLAEKKVDSFAGFLRKDHFEDWSNVVDDLMKRNSKASIKFKDELRDLWELINDVIEQEYLLKRAISEKVTPTVYNIVYRRFNSSVVKAWIKAKDIIKDINKQKYHFHIDQNQINRLFIVRDLGQQILDDGKHEHNSIFRHLDELRDTYNLYVGE